MGWSVGPHLFVQADLEKEEPWKLLPAFEIRPAMAYTDPPWNKGIAAVFRRLADDPRQVDIDLLLRRVAEAHESVTGDVWIEFARENAPMVYAMSAAYWLPVAIFPTTYEKGKRPESLTLFARSPNGRLPVRTPPEPPRYLDSPSLPGYAIHLSSEPGEYVLDACCGHGLTAKMALKAGRRFVGYELNPARLERAIVLAERHEERDRRRVY